MTKPCPIGSFSIISLLSLFVNTFLHFFSEFFIVMGSNISIIKYIV